MRRYPSSSDSGSLSGFGSESSIESIGLDPIEVLSEEYIGQEYMIRGVRRSLTEREVEEIRAILIANKPVGIGLSRLKNNSSASGNLKLKSSDLRNPLRNSFASVAEKIKLEERLHGIYRGSHSDLDVRIRFRDRTKNDKRRKRASFPTNLPIPINKGTISTSSWEYWWINNPSWKRRNVLILLLLSVVSIMQFIAAVYFFISGFIVSYYGTYYNLRVCKTEKCLQLSAWVNSSIDENVNPCEDFYKFMCGHHKTTDKGNLFDFWDQNFARLESDEVTILSQLLERGKGDNEDLSRKVIKYYQVCMEVWQRKTIQLPESLTFIIKDIMRDFNLWEEKDVDKFPTLEIVGSRLISFLGDLGFFKVNAPLFEENDPDITISVDTFKFLKTINEETIGHFLPIIYDALNISDSMDRYETTRWTIFMADRANNLLTNTLPVAHCPPKWDPKYNNKVINFPLAFGIAGFGLDSYNGTLPRLSMERPLNSQNLTVLFQTKYIDSNLIVPHLKRFMQCWNWQTIKIPQRYIRPAYATFWSLRILIELVHDSDDVTANQFNMTDPNNAFFQIFQRDYYGRRMESRCFQSLQDSMGHYPTFRFFWGMDWSTYLDQVITILSNAKNELKDRFKAAEEGGLPWISQHYREHVLRFLDLPKDGWTAITEDDPSFTLQPPNMTDNHVENIYNWRRFTTRRTFHFNVKHNKRNLIVWFRSFYFLDVVNAYPFPGYSRRSLLKYPPSLFTAPFWQNDLMVADFAGSRHLSLKSFMKLVSLSYEQDNTDEIELLYKHFFKHKPLVQQYERRGNINQLKLKDAVEEASAVIPEEIYDPTISDGDFNSCEVLTYDWTNGRELTYVKTNTEERRKFGFQKTITDPHYLSFRFGFNITDNRSFNQRQEHLNGIFPVYISLRSAYQEFFKKVHDLQEKYHIFWKLDRNERKWSIYNKLIHHEKYSQKQLFFMFAIRNTCRSVVNLKKYYNHVTETRSSLMQMEEFAEAWHCPKSSPMNPPNKCFGFGTQRY